jgi:myo-inositol 2-dehydrogenase/D-chiro-inositol 1-dehydrogenase
MKTEETKGKPELSRRDFIKTSAALGAASLAVGTNRMFAAGSDKVRIGLIGCGGRGSGAAAQALTTGESVVLTAMADVFEDRLQRSRKNLQGSEQFGKRVKVPENACFVGLNAYQKVIYSGVDVSSARNPWPPMPQACVPSSSPPP